MTHKLLRRPAVLEIAQISNAHLYALIAANKFPRPLKIGKVSAWLQADVISWIDQRITERDSARKPV